MLGPVLMMQGFAKQPEADGGAIINISAVGVSLAPPAQALSTATKAALEAVTRVVAKELAPRLRRGA